MPQPNNSGIESNDSIIKLVFANQNLQHEILYDLRMPNSWHSATRIEQANNTKGFQMMLVWYDFELKDDIDSIGNQSRGSISNKSEAFSKAV